QAEFQALSSETIRRDWEHQVEISRSATHLIELQEKVIQLDGEVAAEEDAICRLEHEVEMRILRAPVSGRVGKVVELPVGSVVGAGQVFGVLIPAGEPRIVAWFPTASIGRIQPDQRAQLRLAGFPWTQFGTLSATVVSVGNEPSDGRIRVELSLAAAP